MKHLKHESELVHLKAWIHSQLLAHAAKTPMDCILMLQSMDSLAGGIYPALPDRHAPIQVPTRLTCYVRSPNAVASTHGSYRRRSPLLAQRRVANGGHRKAPPAQTPDPYGGLKLCRCLLHCLLLTAQGANRKSHEITLNHVESHGIKIRYRILWNPSESAKDAQECCF